MAITAALVSRLLVFAVGQVAVASVGLAPGVAAASADPFQIALELPARWDATWYVGLASGHYKWDGAVGRFENIAFFPAYPLALQATARAVGAASPASWNWTGVVLSTLLFALALVGLWQMARAFMDERRADWCVWLCATYPFALFFGLPYTESLFLLGLVTAIWAYELQWFGMATVAGVVVGLTRPNGIILVPTLVLLGAAQIRRASRSGHVEASHVAAAGLAAAGPLLGLGVYSAFVYGLTGHPFTWALAQEGWGRPMQNPVGALATPLVSVLINPTVTLSNVPHDVLNAAAGVVALAMSWPIARRFGWAYGVLVAEGVALPLAAGGVASLGRYTAVLFPIYMWLAASLPPAALPWTLSGFAVLDVVTASLFFTWRSLY